ncbi:hypothetical protein ACFQU2_21955 [Siccirubricoccus deserti]
MAMNRGNTTRRSGSTMDGFVTDTMLDEAEPELRSSRPLGAPNLDALVADAPIEDLPSWAEADIMDEPPPEAEAEGEEAEATAEEDEQAAPAAAVAVAGNVNEAISAAPTTRCGCSCVRCRAPSC